MLQTANISFAKGSQRRRRSSLAQLTDLLREWGGGAKRNAKPPLNRRETLADLARSLPWGRTSNENGCQYNNNTANNNTSQSAHAPPLRKRRESSAESAMKAVRNRRDSHTYEFHRLPWPSRDSSASAATTHNYSSGNGTLDNSRCESRRDSGESNRSGRRDSLLGNGLPKIVGATKKRRDSLVVSELPNFRQEQRPSNSSNESCSGQLFVSSSSTHTDTGCQALPPPTIVMSSVTPPATSPTAPPPKGRRDSTTQCGRVVQRRDSRVSPERPRLQRLQRQATAFDESCLPVGGGSSRRGSQPALSPDGDLSERRARRDSLSPDSATRGRRESRTHLSPDRNHDRETSPGRRSQLRRQSSSAGRSPRSPDTGSNNSSRCGTLSGR